MNYCINSFDLLTEQWRPNDVACFSLCLSARRGARGERWRPQAYDARSKQIANAFRFIALRLESCNVPKNPFIDPPSISTLGTCACILTLLSAGILMPSVLTRGRWSE